MRSLRCIILGLACTATGIYGRTENQMNSAVYSREEMQALVNHWIGSPSAGSVIHPIVLQQPDQAARDYFSDHKKSHVFLTIEHCDPNVFTASDNNVFKIADFGDYETMLDESIRSIDYPYSIKMAATVQDNSADNEISAEQVAQLFPKVVLESQMDPRNAQELKIMRSLLQVHGVLLNMEPSTDQSVIYRLPISLESLQSSNRVQAEKAINRWAVDAYNHLKTTVLPDRFLHFVCVPRPSSRSLLADSQSQEEFNGALSMQSSARPHAAAAATNESLPYCIATKDSCSTLTSQCMSRGVCTQIEQCWRCICQQGFTGVQCEYVDYVPSFQIIFWTSLVLILTVVGFTASLFAIDSSLHPQR